MKSKFLIVSLALCLTLSVYAQAYDCGCNDANPCNACNACCKQKCDLFSGLKGLLKNKPCSLNACGPCDAVVACAPCEPVACAPMACAPACEPVACAPMACAPVAACDPVCTAPACDPVCAPLGCDAGCYDPCCKPCDRPVLRAAQKTKANVSRFFNGLFGSLKGCDCGVCNNRGCNACDPCTVAPIACDPCGPAVGCYNNAMPTAVPE